MTLDDFFSDPVNAKLATLLVFSPLHDAEKAAWIEVMPLMTVRQKETLRKNLEEEIEDVLTHEKNMLTAFTECAKKLMNKMQLGEKPRSS